MSELDRRVDKTQYKFCLHERRFIRNMMLEYAMDVYHDSMLAEEMYQEYKEYRENKDKIFH